jgi:hypothetical protein
MIIVLCILFGLLLGMGLGSGNTTGSAKQALLTGLVSGTIVAGICLLGSGGWLIAGCLLGCTVAGSFIAAFMHKDNPIKRYFDLNSKRR